MDFIDQKTPHFLNRKMLKLIKVNEKKRIYFNRMLCRFCRSFFIFVCRYTPFDVSEKLEIRR
jgi:hypothetical protein